MAVQMRDPSKAAGLFEGWEETMIWSCLQNVMGSVYADSLEHPTSALAVLGDFYFLAGEADRELLDCGIGKNPFQIFVPQNEKWAAFIERCFGGKAKRTLRYAFRKERDVFDRAMLGRAVSNLEKGYEIKRLDEELFWQCRELEWCRDFTAQYADYNFYQKYGLGAVILKEGEMVSGASSYSGYCGGIEIEVDTREGYRRRGLAFICGAKLILDCLEREWYPSWDAQNPWSAALAKKLGYRFSHTYAAYEIYEGGI